MSPGVGLKMVGSIEGYANLSMIVHPIGVVTSPIKGLVINLSVILNQFLFHEISSIALGIAKSVFGEAFKVFVRECLEEVRERFLCKLYECERIVYTIFREKIDCACVQICTSRIL